MKNEGRGDRDEKGFWDGGRPGHGSNRESGGGTSGFPGSREPDRTGIQTDLDAPPPPAPPTVQE